MITYLRLETFTVDPLLMYSYDNKISDTLAYLNILFVIRFLLMTYTGRFRAIGTNSIE